MTNHTRPARSWTAPVLLLGFVAAILIVFVANLFLRPGQSPVSAVGGGASPSPVAAASQAIASTGPEARPSASPTPKASEQAIPIATASARTGTAAIAACHTKDLEARIVAWEGAAGSRIAELSVRNAGPAACSIAEPTRLRLVAADGTVLIDSAKLHAPVSTAPGAPAITVGTGASVRTDVRVANVCGATPNGAIGVSVSWPGGATLHAMPASGVSSTDAIPPCNGPIGPEIEMNGWQG